MNDLSQAIVGDFDEEGFLYIVDRMKDVINSGGVLVASREVEVRAVRQQGCP